jgi:uncharacterized protein (TIGR02569 family)
VVPAAVLEAFGLPERGEPLPGGERRCFRHDRAVLKPVDDDAEAEWSAQLLSGLAPDGFRLARPLRSRDGRWLVDGWSATELVAGETGPAGRWPELLKAGRAFHAALAGAPRPAFLDGPRHRWAHADRVAWDEAAAEVPPEAAEHWSRLHRLRRPVSAPAQLIHGDLAGNALFQPDAAPAIIDFSPFWRPADYADAIVAVDGLLWHGAGPDLVSLPWTGADFAQLLVRAAIFRLIALTERDRAAGPVNPEELAEFVPVLELLEQL